MTSMKGGRKRGKEGYEVQAELNCVKKSSENKL
jgi:hypothetical protein